ncbi:MAG: DNA-binding protein [Desulfobia sp.]
MLLDRKIYLTAGLIMALVFLGCSDQSESNASANKSESGKTGSMQAPSSAGEKGASPNGAIVEGKVSETFDSGGYTYLKLDTEAGEKWAATAQTDVQKGEDVALKSGPVMRDFHSESLDRTFPEIIFSGGLVGESSAGAGQVAGMMGSQGSNVADSGQEEADFQNALQSEGGGGSMSSSMQQPDSQDVSGGSEKSITEAQDISVEKSSAENGYTIGEIYSEAGELDGEEVRVRGKVVKVLPNIMGKTWVHLQDGTGSAGENTHDLVFTSEEDNMPGKGQEVEMQGVLAKDKDFGAGYSYKVIVEKAEIVE